MEMPQSEKGPTDLTGWRRCAPPISDQKLTHPTPSWPAQALGREEDDDSKGGLCYSGSFAVIWQQLATETVRTGHSPL